MAKYEVKIKIEAATTEEIKSVGCALQNAANCIFTTIWLSWLTPQSKNRHS